MALTPLQVRNVCCPSSSSGGLYQQTVCRYFTSQMVGSNYSSLCTKKSPAEYDKLKKSTTWTDRDKMPDNCPGFLYLLHKKQGYDVP